MKTKNCVIFSIAVLLLTCLSVSAQEAQNVELIGSIVTNGYAHKIDTDQFNQQTMFVADGENGVLKINISDPSNPTLSARFDTDGDSYGVEVSGGMIYVADATNGVIALNNGAELSFQDEYDTPGEALGLTYYNGYLFIADGTCGTRTLHWEHNEFVEADALETPGLAVDVFFDYANNILYVADQNGWLRIIDASDRANLTEITYFESRFWTQSVFVDVFNDLAYIAEYNYGLRILDVSDPANPEDLGEIQLPGGVVGVFVEGDYAYTASTMYGVRVLDISDPADPVEVGFYDPEEGAVNDVFVLNGLIYAANSLDLLILQFEPPEQEQNPAITVEPEILDFERVNLANQASLPITITNTGDAVLTISNILAESPFSVAFEGEFTLEPEAFRDVAVTFAPEELGIFQSVLTVTSDDPDQGETTVNLIGQGIPEPREVSWTERLLDDNFDRATDVYACDLDGDGDMDVLGAASVEGKILWWENLGDQTFNWHEISGNYDGACSVYAIDIDSDGDMDVLGAAISADDITWWENDGSQNFTEHTIAGNFDGANCVFATDVDSDGDIDVLGTAFNDDDITWWENDGGQNFTIHTIKGNFDGATSVFATDVDSDGDMDVLGTASSAYNITWWENDGDENFREHTIDENFIRANSVHVADVDSDGDQDVLGAANYADDLTWWENDGDERFTAHIIDGNFNGANSVHTADIDLDGDMDVLGAAITADDITWWENDGNENFTEHTIAGNFDEANCVFAADIDSDGDMDVLGTASGADDITWWENHLIDSPPVNGQLRLVDGISVEPDIIFASPVDNFSVSFTVLNIGERSMVDFDLFVSVLDANGSFLFDLEVVHVDELRGRESIEYENHWGNLDHAGTFFLMARVGRDGQRFDIDTANEGVNPLEITVNPGLVHFEPVSNTGSNHSLLIMGVNVDDEPMRVGNEIGVFTTEGLCAGATVWQGQLTGLAAWGDNDQTEEIDGFQEGEQLSYRVWDYQQRVEYIAVAEYSEGDGEFGFNEFSVLTLLAEAVTEQHIGLTEGWNMISTNIDIQEHDVPTLLSELVAREHLNIFKNGEGDFYAPSFDFNNIEGWVVSEGYQANVTENEELVMTGLQVPFDQPIALQEGWQIISYYPTWLLDATTAFENVEENLILAKDNVGQFYAVEFEYSNMGFLRSGQGYQVKMRTDDDLIYPPANEDVDTSPEFNPQPPRFVIQRTSNNMSLLVCLKKEEFMGASVIAQNDNGKIVGEGVIGEDGRCGVAVWGDDDLTIEREGLTSGEAFSLALIDANGEVNSLEVENILAGDGLVYETNDFIAVDAVIAAVIPSELSLTSAYPNPFNAVTRLSYGLPDADRVLLGVYDVSGRQVATLFDGEQVAGMHTVSWNAEGMPSGLYLVRLSASSATREVKVLLMK